MNVNSFILLSASTVQQTTSVADSATWGTDSSVAKTDTFTVTPTEFRNVPTDTSGNAQWLYIGTILVIVIVFAYIFYRQINTLKDCIQRLNKISIEQNTTITSLNRTIELLRNRIDTFEQNAKKSETTVLFSNTKESRRVSVNGTTPTSGKPKESVSIEQSTSTIVKYATMQAPDANGTLRFAERSMTDEVTDQKMFEVELNTVKGTGTYRVNLRAMSILMNDLQQLRDFVEPFTTNGNNSAQHIINEKPGKIHQDGKFWIVDELAKIKIV